MTASTPYEISYEDIPIVSATPGTAGSARSRVRIYVRSKIQAKADTLVGLDKVPGFQEIDAIESVLINEAGTTWSRVLSYSGTAVTINLAAAGTARFVLVGTSSAW